MKRAGRFGRWMLAVLSAAMLSGCLLTLGGPLARRVEPGCWRVEGAAGPSLVQYQANQLDALLYGYAGRALGRHWEVGFLPYAYSVFGTPVIALAVPFRWDPFPYGWPLHLVPFAGPVGFFVPGAGAAGGGLAGLGFSLRLGELAEIYAAASSFVPNARFSTASVGARFDLANGLELGVGVIAQNQVEEFPGLLLASISLSALLGQAAK